MRILWPVAWLLMFAMVPSAAAQAPCTQADPCTLALDVDETTLSFGADATVAVTAGDWFVIDAFNLDDVPHDIAIADLGIEFTVPAFDQGSDGTVFGPYLFDAPGEYQVTDLTSGAVATLQVVLEDVSGGDEGEDSPGLSWLAGASVVALAAIAARRRL